MLSRRARDGWRSADDARSATSSLLRGDHKVLDLVVRGLGNDLLLDQLVLTLVGPAVDDLLRVGITDSRKRLQVVGGRAIEINQLLLGGRLLLALGGRLFLGLRPRRGDGITDGDDKGNEDGDESWHGAPPS